MFKLSIFILVVKFIWPPPAEREIAALQHKGGQGIRAAVLGQPAKKISLFLNAGFRDSEC